MDTISWCDHSAGASRFVSKINLSPPDDCRLYNDPSLNCRQVPFRLSDCKKDVAEILDLASDDINTGMQELADDKLGGFKDRFKNSKYYYQN